MARIRSITVVGTGTSVHPSEVDAEVKQIVAPTGDVLLQLSTFGSDERITEPKVSQTIQLDRRTAHRLRELIDQTFGEA